MLFGTYIPAAGAPVFAILAGFALAAARWVPASCVPGCSFAGKALLQFSIVLLGAQLSLGEIVSGGLASLPVMLGTFAVVLAAAFVLGRALGLDRDVRRLIGIGTAICGGSAIAALSSVVEVDASDVAYALGTIFFFNIVAVLAFPPLGHLMHLAQHAFGVWAGTAINDTSSVVAAGFSYGRVAGNGAVIVKLTRTLLIVPTVGYYAIRRILGATAGTRDVDWVAIVPWFVLWFLIAAALNSAGFVPAIAHAPLQRTALFTIAIALAGVGASADVNKIKAAGFRPLVLGGVLWVTISLASLGFARLFGVL